MKRMVRIFLLLNCVMTVLFLCAFSPAGKDPDARATITLYYQKYTVKYVDNIIKPTDHLVAEDIHIRKINAGYIEKMAMVDTCLYAGADFKTALLYSFPLLEKTVETTIAAINKEAVDSKITFFPDQYPMFSIAREKTGLEVNEKALYQMIYYALRRNSNIKIAVAPKVIQAVRTAEDNIKLTNLRAKFSTDYSHSNEDRIHNIDLSLSKINGTVLGPGQEFSFNQVVGRRSTKNKFRNSKIIKGGEYVEGVGGGVCQASTTVYNCALLADMEITAVRNHSLEPSYVLPSFDAMVNSGSSDLKFKNNGEDPVFLRAYGTGTQAVVEIYGSRLPYRIVRKSEVTERKEAPADREEIDKEHKHFPPEEPVAAGTKKRIWFSKGEMRSEGYLLYYDWNGKFLERKHIRTDKYNSTRGLIAIAP